MRRAWKKVLQLFDEDWRKVLVEEQLQVPTATWLRSRSAA
jgi:hypothetical protein